MKRTVKKQFWLSRDEAQELQKKAKRTCLSEAALFRLLVRGFEPKEKPDDRFYDVMRQLSAIGNNLHQLTVKANALGFLDMQKRSAGTAFRRMWSGSSSVPKRATSNGSKQALAGHGSPCDRARLRR